MRTLHLALLASGLIGVTAANAQLAAQAPQPKQPPQNALTSYYPKATFPAVTYACMSIVIPPQDDAATKVVEGAHSTWLSIAQRGGLTRASATFLHAQIPAGQGMDADGPLPAQVCAVVDNGTQVPGLTTLEMQERQGVAGFCTNLQKVEQCLAAAAEVSGYTEQKPWTWLPVYGRWSKAIDSPKSAADVVGYLIMRPIDIKSIPIGKGKAKEFHEDAKELVKCEQDCVAKDGHVVVDASGPGIGWFIPAAIGPATAANPAVNPTANAAGKPAP